MPTANLVLDILIYACAGVIVCVGAYVVFRFVKGEARKRKKNRK